MIRRAPRKEDWFVAFSKHAQNSNMSFKATGLYFYLCSLPDNWKINRKDLSNRKTDGSTSVQTIMAELRELGYLRIEMIRDSEGRIISKELVFYEDPEELSLVPEKPSDGHKGAIVQGSTGLEESSTESKDLPVQERESSFAKVAEPNESGPVSLSLEQHKLPDLNANDPISRWLKEYWKHRPTSGHPLARLGISDVLESMTRVENLIETVGEDKAKSLLQAVFNKRPHPVSVIQAVYYCQKLYEESEKGDDNATVGSKLWSSGVLKWNPEEAPLLDRAGSR